MSKRLTIKIKHWILNIFIVLTSLITTFVIMFNVMNAIPSQNNDQSLVLQERLMDGIRSMSTGKETAQQVMESTIKADPSSTTEIIGSGNVDSFYQLFNDVIVYTYYRNNLDSKYVLNDIKENLNQFMYTKDLSAISSWNMSN